MTLSTKTFSCLGNFLNSLQDKLAGIFFLDTSVFHCKWGLKYNLHKIKSSCIVEFILISLFLY